MKHIRFLLYLAALANAVLLFGCSEYLFTDDTSSCYPSLEQLDFMVSPYSYSFPSGGSTESGMVWLNSGDAWEFSSVPSWLSITPMIGYGSEEITITASENKLQATREAVFYFTAAKNGFSHSITLTASQEAASPYVRFLEESTSIEVDCTSGSRTIAVESNISDLEVSIAASWCTATYSDNAKTVTIQVQANESDYSRSDYLYLRSSSSTSQYTRIQVVQLPSGLSVADGIAMTYDADGGTQTRTIKSDLPWTATSANPWIDFTPKSGSAGETSVSISAQPSYETGDRKGQIYFYFGDTQKKYISITQTGRYINATPSAIEINADGNEASSKLYIESNIGWVVSSKPDWITLDAESGEAGSTSISLSATKNSSLNTRSGYVIINDTNSGAIEKKITVTQAAIDFGNQDALSFGWQASSQSMSIPQFSSRWTAAVSAGWISLSNYAGSGEETTITVSVTRNDSEEPRTSTISFTNQGQTVTVDVVQQGQYIHVENTGSYVDVAGGTINFSFDSTIDVIPSVEYDGEVSDWISFEKQADGSYNIIVEANPSVYERTSYFVLTPSTMDVSDTWSSGVKFAIIQRGRNLTVNVSEIHIFAKGGTTETYTITVDGAFGIMLEQPAADNWVTIIGSDDGSDFYLIATENTSTAKRTATLTFFIMGQPAGEGKVVTIPIVQSAAGDVDIIIDNFNEPIIW